MKILSDRLAETFVQLCEMSSPSRREGLVAAFIRDIFKGLGAEVVEDGSATSTGSNSGNLVVRIEGNPLMSPLFFNAHMDTVSPGEGIKVRREGDIFSSTGNTVLGGDDKSGIAILIEVFRTLAEHHAEHGPIDLIFTTCEEIGLLGAKHLDITLLRANHGFSLDSSGIDQVIVGAPAANRIKVELKGLAAHAGLEPEKGINAIYLAAQAIAMLRLGRLDHESTANIGLISGGTATNIIPDRVEIEGEVRSHSIEKLALFTREIRQIFEQAVSGGQGITGQDKGVPDVTFVIQLEYPLLKVAMDAPVVQRVSQAAAKLGRTLKFIAAGGGSDANIFSSYGLNTVILGTGMQQVHTVDEWIALSDMVRTAELLCATITG